MSFVELKHYTAQDQTRQQQRISLVIQYSFTTYFVFYQNGAYQHINREEAVVIHQGNFQFIPSKYLSSKQFGRIVVLGSDKQSNFYCGIIDVQNQYFHEVRLLSDKAPELTTKYHLYEPNEGNNIFIAMILKNIENGIAISFYDFNQDQWSQSMVSLPSQFLNYHLVDCSVHSHLYKEKFQISCHALALVALGDRFDSINYSKIKICQENGGQKNILKTKFIVTRQVKLNQHFILKGAMQIDENYFYIVGNSRVGQINGDSFLCLPAYVILNSVSLDSNDPQPITVQRIDFGLKQKQSIQLNYLVDIAQSNMFFVLTILHRKSEQIAIARFNKQTVQLLLITRIETKMNLQISSKKDCLFAYSLECQQFFQKMKSTFSKINFTLIKIQGKKLQYRKLIKKTYPDMNQYFATQVLSLL